MHAVIRFGILAVALSLSACGGGNDSPSTPVSAATVHAVTGTVNNVADSGLTLQSGAETIVVQKGASSFAFASTIKEGADYSVTVVAHPAGQHCVVSNGTGKMAHDGAAELDVSCHTLISKPTPVGVYPVAADSHHGSRVFLPIAKVGAQAVTINAVLDTGSSGSLLYAPQIFPDSVLGADGFKFPEGKDTLTYKGIKVTKVTGYKEYGSGGEQKLEGNIGYAQMTIGAGSEVTTASVPILLIRKRYIRGNDNQWVEYTDTLRNNMEDNIVGINTNVESVDATAAGKLPATSVPVVCKDVPQTQCGLLNALRAYTHASGMESGFVLNAFKLQDCSIETPGSCQPQTALSLGVNDSISAAFKRVGLTCKNVVAADDQPLKTCEPYVSGTNTLIDGVSYPGSVMVDSGAPHVRLEVFVGSGALPVLNPGKSVSLNFPGGFSYSYMTASSGPATTSVSAGANANVKSNAGIEFFMDHTILINFDRGEEGWK
ncbi:hypothetical protein [Caballeronia sp. BR00000012568055]|uniref:hypothetical protein n=1 Tax=Caballeronia sp. BR00000012568055 TaxID=2918761 RepID=UPI0023F9B63B|nr:hypothetical protein [Caballeronia sp. BR00000012568055]